MTALGFGLAVVIGLSLGMLGGGGSILTVPVLVYVLRYSMKTAVPMNLVVVGVTSLFGAVSHHRNRNIRWDAALAFGPASVLGAFAGGKLGMRVPSSLQLGIFAVFMIVAAVSMYFGPALWGGSRSEAEPSVRRPLPAILALGAGVGVFTGLIGIGGGFLYVPALVLLGGVAMKQAVGTSLVLIVLSCVAGFLSYMTSVPLDWRATALFTGLAIAGVLTGSALVKRVSQDSLRRGFAVFVLVMGAIVLWRAVAEARP